MDGVSRADTIICCFCCCFACSLRIRLIEVASIISIGYGCVAPVGFISWLVELGLLLTSIAILIDAPR